MESTVEAADYYSVLISAGVIALLVNLEADIDCPLDNEERLKALIRLLQDKTSSQFETRLQLLQHPRHEVAVDLVSPIVEASARRVLIP